MLSKKKTRNPLFLIYHVAAAQWAAELSRINPKDAGISSFFDFAPSSERNKIKKMGVVRSSRSLVHVAPHILS